jgi:hypothetical protein
MNHRAVDSNSTWHPKKEQGKNSGQLILRFALNILHFAFSPSGE